MHIFGKHPVDEVLRLRPDVVKRIFIDNEKRRPKTDRPVEMVDRDRLESLVRGNHQGIVAEVSEYQYANLSVVTDKKVCMFLDQVQDPQNMGAIARVAAAFDIPLVIPKDRSAAVNGTVVRASAGLVYAIDIVRVTNIARTLDQLKEEGFWSVALVMDGEQTISEIKYDTPTAFVAGGEPGIRRLTREKCDFTAKIPMASGVESLNVATAVSIAMYEFRR